MSSSTSTRAGVSHPSSIQLPLLCFNDVYRVEQRYNAPTPAATTNTPAGGTGPSATTNPPQSAKEQKICVGQFARTLLDVRDSWPKRAAKQYDGAANDMLQRSEEEAAERDGLVLFAGDVFNPSVESSVTRGSHMVPIMNALKVDVACVGNHDFDFGYPHLTTLISSTKFPWLLSNIIDIKTDTQPDAVKRFCIFERCGARIGVIGLVEKDWIATIPSWPETFQYRDMAETALQLSTELRDPTGPHKVDIIIALTHCRLPNDIDLANTLGAVKDADSSKHGVDLLIGGHDHIYYIGRGVDSWDNFERNTRMRGVDKDRGVYLIKSGTDFRDLSEASLELARTEDGGVRRMVIKRLTGKHLEITPDTPTSTEVDELTKSLLSTVTKTLTKPVCFTLTPFDVRSEIVRTQESAVGNWIADVLLHAYSEMIEDTAPDSEAERGHGNGHSTAFDKEGAPSPRDRRQADCTIICGGTLRGDSQYGPGKITLGDILEILPFEDPAVCLEIDGEGIWDCLESALSKWPQQEGRFPIVSGLAVKWDHTKPPMQRVISIHLLDSDSMLDDRDETESPGDPVEFVEQEDGTVIEVKKRPLRLGEAVENKSGGRMYRLITREYMAEGYDGFDALKGRRFIVDDDNGQIMSSILRSFLLGSSYIFRHKQLREEHTKHRSKQTDKVLNKARNRFQRDRMGQPPNRSPATARKLDSVANGSTRSPPLSPTSAGVHIVEHSPHDIRDALRTARSEHMSEIDALDGKTLRASQPKAATEETAPAAASFLVDSRNRDEIRSMDLDLAVVSPLIDGRLKDVSEDQQ